MRDKLRKIVFWRPGYRVVAGAALILFAVMLIPLIRLMVYTAPWYDDYGYGMEAKRLWEERGTLLAFFEGAYRTACGNWYAWQGTYTSMFFMGAMPAVFGEQYYFLGPLFILIMLIVSTFFLTWVLLRRVVGADRAPCIVMQVAVASIVINFMHTAQAGLYWYNSGVHYMAMHSFSMIMLGFVILMLSSESRKGLLFLIPSLLGAFLSAGSNYVTSLQGLLVLVLMAVVGFVFYRKRVWTIFPVLALYSFAFYKNVSAPGNAVRGAYYEGHGYGVIGSILESFAEACRRFWGFTGWRTFICLIVMAPVIWHIVEKSRVRFRWPLLVVLLSFCFYATGFTSSFYSVGHTFLGRTINAAKVTFQLLLIFCEVYLLGWLRQRTVKWGGQIAERLKESRAVWWFYPVMAALLLLAFSREINPIGNYAAFGAYYYIHSGEAYNFYVETEERLEIFKNDEPDVEVMLRRWQPYFLCSGELSPDPTAEQNEMTAEWYGKNSIRLLLPEE